MKRRSPLHDGRAFTLAELLVAMAIIALLATITVVAVGGIANDARLATGKNTVTTVLDNARALAIRRNRVVLVVFRPREHGENEQYVEAVFAEWRGESPPLPGESQVHDRFVPIPDVPARALPRGIQVACPLYGLVIQEYPGRENDTVWVTQTYLPNQPVEAPGQLVGVMYAPDGSTITRNSQNDSSSPWVDFDLDHVWDRTNGEIWKVIEPDDEPFVNLSPFLAVYDDTEAREMTGAQGWSSDDKRTLELTDYITTRADRIHFNRYTGVVTR
jgi:prepilin-type N-terminal cleavage/methylation domain-containing protein